MAHSSHHSPEGSTQLSTAARATAMFSYVLKRNIIFMTNCRYITLKLSNKEIVITGKDLGKDITGS